MMMMMMAMLMVWMMIHDDIVTSRLYEKQVSSSQPYKSAVCVERVLVLDTHGLVMANWRHQHGGHA